MGVVSTTAPSDTTTLAKKGRTTLCRGRPAGGGVSGPSGAATTRSSSPSRSSTSSVRASSNRKPMPALSRTTVTMPAAASVGTVFSTATVRYPTQGIIVRDSSVGNHEVQSTSDDRALWVHLLIAVRRLVYVAGLGESHAIRVHHYRYKHTVIPS